MTAGLHTCRTSHGTCGTPAAGSNWNLKEEEEEMATRKRMTKKEIRERAEAKKWAQEAGLVPPDKPKLNRKKFIKEAFEEWDERPLCYTWDHYLTHAVAFMSTRMDRRGNPTPEAVGAVKVLRCAVALQRLVEQKREAGEAVTYGMEFEALKSILEA